MIISTSQRACKEKEFELEFELVCENHSEGKGSRRHGSSAAQCRQHRKAVRWAGSDTITARHDASAPAGCARIPPCPWRRRSSASGSPPAGRSRRVCFLPSCAHLLTSEGYIPPCSHMLAHTHMLKLRCPTPACLGCHVHTASRLHAPLLASSPSAGCTNTQPV